MKRIWFMFARYVDKAIDEMLLERLQATTIDEAAWEQAVANSQQGSQGEVRRIQNALRAAEQTKRSIVENLKTLTHPDLVKQLQSDYVNAEHDVERLQAELKHLQHDKGHKRLLLEARPVLEMVVTHWDKVSPEDRRELFEAFAEYVIVNRPQRGMRHVTIHWRDGTKTSEIARRDRKHTFWAADELELLREMVQRRASQIELLQAFPDATWRMLRERYSYHFNSPKWCDIYKGVKPKYKAMTRWRDTDEYRETQTAASANCSTPLDLLLTLHRPYVDF
jgi:hypothetical protein